MCECVCILIPLSIFDLLFFSVLTWYRFVKPRHSHSHYLTEFIRSCTCFGSTLVHVSTLAIVSTCMLAQSSCTCACLVAVLEQPHLGDELAQLLYRYRGVELFQLSLTQNIDCPISKIDLYEQELSATVRAHLEFVISSATASDQRSELNMQDKVF